MSYVPLESDGRRYETEPETNLVGAAARTKEEGFVKMTPSRKIYPNVLTAMFILLSIWGAADLGLRLWDLKNRHFPAHQRTLPCYCGTTLEEAEALGCSYVAMSSAWLPDHCRDAELEAEFDASGTNEDGTWNYFADGNMTEPLTRNQVREMAGTNGRYYTSWEWHVVHCLFYWRKLHRAQFSGVTMEPRFNTDGHIHHCSRLIVNGGSEDVTVSGIDTGDELISAVRQQMPTKWDDLRL
ncbi:hypothetical protein QQS21_010932 [Conoideocrella luteorostrata]|uniref:Uncharacterized protein n=1 Tax=Conoideocrella luteorostrata TaxID=1105319 RepID=A0AAJ0FP00_9HYPO|nr:hypothetical protein QQS21_010932 [Conoideocrella luteorostrata]